MKTLFNSTVLKKRWECKKAWELGVLKRRFRHAQQLIGENSRNVAVGFLKISRYYFEYGVYRSPPPLENEQTNYLYIHPI